MKTLYLTDKRPSRIWMLVCSLIILGLLQPNVAGGSSMEFNQKPPEPLRTIERVRELPSATLIHIEPLRTIVGCEKWDSFIDANQGGKGDAVWAKRVMRCESTCNEKALNGSSGASGIMQFLPRTFRANGGKNIWNGEEQVVIAMKMFRNGQSWQWSCK